jgi:hypothetical protein
VGIWVQVMLDDPVMAGAEVKLEDTFRTLPILIDSLDQETIRRQVDVRYWIEAANKDLQEALRCIHLYDHTLRKCGDGVEHHRAWVERKAKKVYEMLNDLTEEWGV